jgi:ketosteroid isomerase-like protein
VPANDVERARAAWNAMAAPGASRDLPSETDELWAPDIVYVEDPSWPGAATFHGRDAVSARFREYGDALGEHTELEVEDVRAVGSVVLSIIVFRGRSATGVPWDHRWGYVTRMRDGRIAEWRAYHDPDEAQAAAEGTRPTDSGE